MHKSLRFLLIIVFCLAPALLAGCEDEENLEGVSDSSDVEQIIGELGVLADRGPAAFDEWVDAAYRNLLLRYPETVTALGLGSELGTRNGRLNDYTAEYVGDTERLDLAILDQLERFDRNALDADDRQTYDVCLWYWTDRVEGYAFSDLDYPISHFFVTSRHLVLYDLLTERHPLASLEDAKDYVLCLQQIGRQFDETIEDLRGRADRGVIAPAPLLVNALDGLRGMKNASGDRHPFMEPLILALDGAEWADKETRDGLLDAARGAIRDVVTPAYERLYDEVRTLSSDAPSDLGLWQYENGEAYYAYILRHHNQTTLTPAEIHETGLREVERLRAEILAASAFLGLDSDISFSQRYAHIAQGGGAYRSREIVDEYTRLIEEAESRLSDVVSHVPRIPVIVEGNSIGGYYVAAPGDGSRPAVFYASDQGATYHYDMPTLAYHEAIPGHHLQIATAQELDLPLLRRVETFLGYTEGWALYAERLAWELGWYDLDPYGNLGRLQDEMMRAVRLVVDTGIHAFRWTSEQAVQYFVDNTGQSRGYAEYEVLRYAAWPGQATAYMLGMLDILDLRSRMQESQGEAFDLVAFHDALLSGGSLPLEMIDSLFEEPV